MTNIAHVDQNGIVVNIVVGEAPIPEGCTAVETETAGVGQIYDASTGTFADPDATPERLMVFNQERLRQNLLNVTVEIEELGPVTIDPSMQNILSRAVDVASAKNSKLVLYLPKDSTNYYTVNAKQVIALNKAVTEKCIDLMAAYHTIQDDITAGKITRVRDVVSGYEK